MRIATALLVGCAALAACSDETRLAAPRDGNARDGGNQKPNRDGGARTDAGQDEVTGNTYGLTFRGDVSPVLRVEDSLDGTFIPPFVSCVPPLDDKPGLGPEGQVCTNVAISGATEPGRYFPDYASCDVVLRQRPFWSKPPAAETKPDDPRLQDDAYLAELGWVSEQIEATGCVCCHDSTHLGKQAGTWDIRLGPLWLDSLSDSGLALFAGLADSSSLGAYDAADNFGFQRDVTGIPSTDAPRMRKFMVDELARRGITEEEARAVPPFGGPIYANRIAVPKPCAAGEGVTPGGDIVWSKNKARYIYVGTAGSGNPGVPPNLDMPADTLFRLDVLASAEALESGVRYGTTPAGSFQFFPESTPATALEVGTTYHLTVLRDVGAPLANCLFTFGDEVPEVVPPDPETPPVSVDGGAVAGPDGGVATACTLPGGDAKGWGAPCTSDANCTCEASYCALQPGQTTGYCSKTGCKENPAVCPSSWSCFDVSAFAPGQPSICTK